jgi:type III secretion system (T3SS) inner membrane Yop/YscD-like protein
MALLVRIYFNAVFGALGGLLGWMLFGVLGDKNPQQPWQMALLGGACVGGLIGYFVVSVEAIRDRSLVRFCRLASYGVVLGILGGALGMWVGDEVNFWLVGLLGGGRGTPALLGSMLARGLGWMFLGAAVGVSEGVAARSLGKLSYGTLGGTLGGFVGGSFFGLCYLETVSGAAGDSVWKYLWAALGLIILGACIGALSALVQGVFQPALVRVVRGWQEGREYPLLKANNSLGRDERADVALFRDMKVEKRHALIQREGNDRFVFVNNGAPPEFTRVNDEPIANTRDLQDGDRIQLGNVVLRFHRRAARERLARPRPRRVTPAAAPAGKA